MSPNKKLLMGNLASAMVVNTDGEFTMLWEATVAGVVVSTTDLMHIALMVRYPKSDEERILKQECQLAAVVGIDQWAHHDEADLLCNREGHSFNPIDLIDWADGEEDQDGDL